MRPRLRASGPGEVKALLGGLSGRFIPPGPSGAPSRGRLDVLPTGRTARFASGLSVFDFLKRTTWVEAEQAGLAAIGPAAVTLAKAEGLDAHGLSVSARLGGNP